LKGRGPDYMGVLYISQVIDPDLIHQQLEAGCFDWSSCVKLVNDIMSILGPFGFDKALDTDENKPSWTEVQQLLANATVQTQPTVFCTALEFILDRVKAVRIKIANIHLTMIAPLIKTHGVEYEQKHFEKKLIKQQIELIHTEAWIRTTLTNEINHERIKLGDLIQHGSTTTAAYLAVLKRGIVGLVTGLKQPNSKTCPETLLLDVRHLATIYADFRLQVCVASSLIIVGQKLVELRVKNPAKVLHDMGLAMISNASNCNNIGDTIKTVCLVLADNKELAMDKCDLLLLSVVLKNGVKPDAVVPNLLSKRLREVLLLGIEGTGDIFADITSTTNAFKQYKLPQAVYAIATSVRASGLLLRKIAHINTQVHASHYNKIIAEVSTSLASKP
jgi:hypothetical protein